MLNSTASMAFVPRLFLPWRSTDAADWPLRVVTKSHVSRMESIGCPNGLEPAFVRKDHKTFDGCVALSWRAAWRRGRRSDEMGICPPCRPHRQRTARYLSRSPRPRNVNTILRFCYFHLLVQWLIRCGPALFWGCGAIRLRSASHLFRNLPHRGPVSASQANGEHVSAGADGGSSIGGGSRKMADVNRVYLDGVQP